MPPYRQMFYQLCDLNVEEYVVRGPDTARVGTVGLGTKAFPAALPLSIGLGGKPCLGWGHLLGAPPSASWPAGAVSRVHLRCTPELPCWALLPLWPPGGSGHTT